MAATTASPCETGDALLARTYCDGVAHARRRVKKTIAPPTAHAMPPMPQPPGCPRTEEQAAHKMRTWSLLQLAVTSTSTSRAASTPSPHEAAGGGGGAVCCARSVAQACDGDPRTGARAAVRQRVRSDGRPK